VALLPGMLFIKICWPCSEHAGHCSSDLLFQIVFPVDMKPEFSMFFDKLVQQASTSLRDVSLQILQSLSLASLDVPLCDTCSRINWNHIFKGTLTAAAQRAFETREMYQLDLLHHLAGPFLRCKIPSIVKRAADMNPCPLCLLWLRAYRRVYPDGDAEREHSGPDSFTYYVQSADDGDQWIWSPLGIDDDAQAMETRRKAMRAFRMRLSGSLNVKDFESDLELTCLDSDLLSECRSRGGRLLADDSCHPNLFKDWLRLCQRDHGSSCDGFVFQDATQKAEGAFKPRLVDVDRLMIVVGSFNDRLCALSYVWGPNESFKAKTSYFEPDYEHIGEVCLDLRPHLPSTRGNHVGNSEEKLASPLIPRSILDAIEVTRRLGEKFLWVDSLCIIQDTDELAASIPCMDSVYGKAVLTIVAAAGSDSNAGLPRAHPNAPRISQITERIHGRTFMLAQPSLNRVLRRSTWASRGWTFQEGKLSPHQLIFTDHGIYFRCQMDTWAEDSVEKMIIEIPNDLRRKIRRFMDTSEESPENRKEADFAEYTYDVRSYTARSLGHQGDALRAFASLVSQFQRKKLRTRFLWGLPQSYLDAALLWKCVDLWDYGLWAPTEESHNARRYDKTNSDGSDSVEKQRKAKALDEDGENDSEGNKKEEEDYERERKVVGGVCDWETEYWSNPSNTPHLSRRKTFPSWSWCGWQASHGVM
jgi:hypothetical protein